jgi:hypothetical protein
LGVSADYTRSAPGYGGKGQVFPKARVFPNIGGLPVVPPSNVVTSSVERRGDCMYRTPTSIPLPGVLPPSAVQFGLVALVVLVIVVNWLPNCPS